MKKIVLITGASSGIGYKTAIKLNAQGYKVYACARRAEKLKPLKQLGIETIILDVTKTEDNRAAVEYIIRNEGRIDVLINNAGFGMYGALEEVSEDAARNQFDVNVFGLMDITRRVLPHMRKNRSGTIVNVSSIAGKAVQRFGGWYHASKFAVEGLSDVLRSEVKPFGIDVIIIEPGLIKTEWSGIANEHLSEFSKDSEYKDFLVKVPESANASDPQVIADCIAKAISKKNPKTRYAVGKMAKATVFGRWLFTDRMMDRLALKMK